MVGGPRRWEAPHPPTLLTMTLMDHFSWLKWFWGSPARPVLMCAHMLALPPPRPRSQLLYAVCCILYTFPVASSALLLRPAHSLLHTVCFMLTCPPHPAYPPSADPSPSTPLRLPSGRPGAGSMTYLIVSYQQGVVLCYVML